MSKKKRNILLWGMLGIQILFAVLYAFNFIIENYTTLAGKISWKGHELVEVGTGIGLVLGAVMGIILIKELMQRNHKIEAQLRVVSGEFQKMLEENFDEWALSKSEKDVAYFAIKGMSNAEIANLRGTSDGTVKAQMNAVYKKAGFESRVQLLGYFIEELLADDAESPVA